MNKVANKLTQFQLSHKSLLWVHLVLILLTGILVYSNSFYAPFELDDHYSISFYGSSKIRDLLLHGSSRRVVDITFALNHLVHGLQVTGYHVVNLSIHLATAVTLYFFVISAIKSQFKEAGSNESIFLSRFAPISTALLFVSHPLQTQAVTYIIQRFTSMAALFYLLSAFAFIKLRCVVDQGKNRRYMWVWGSATVITALLALGSKQISATLPLMLILLEYILFQGRLLNRRFFIVCGVVLISIPAVLLYEWHQGTLDDFLFDLRHATSDNIYTSRMDYFLTQTRVVVTYMRLLVLPINQNLIYEYPIYRSFFSTPVLASCALHSTLIVFAVVLFRMSRRNHSPTDRTRALCQQLAALGIAWFYITLSIESSFIPIRDVIFEHRVYLPSVGFFLMITSLTALAVHDQRGRAKAAWMLLVVCCLILSGMTISRNHVWRDSLTLWQDNALKSPNKGIVLSNLAAEYLSRNIPEKALPLFVRATEVNPNVDFRTKTGIGSSMRAMGIYPSRFTTGEEYILPGGIYNAGELNFGKYSQWEGVINNATGLAYEYLNEPAKARRMYEASVTMNPDYDLGWYNLAILSAKEGKKQAVIEAIRHLKTLNPAMANAVESTMLH